MSKNSNNEFRIFVSTPLEHAEDVKKAIYKAGAEIIGTNSFHIASLEAIEAKKSNNNFNSNNDKNDNLDFFEETFELLCDIDKVDVVDEKLRELDAYEDISLNVFPLSD